MKDRIHCHHVEGSIPPQRPQRDARILIDVPFADFDEAAKLGEARKPHRDRLGGERVEDHVHAAPIGQFHHRLREISAARVDYMLHAERLQQRALGRAAGAGDDFRPEMMRDLDRRHPHPTRSRMHQDALALAKTRHVLERVP